MKTGTLIFSGGAAAIAALFLGYRKAEETKNAVVAASGGDAKQAAQAQAAAKVATTPVQVQAAAEQVQAAATAAPPSSPEVIAEAEEAVTAAQESTTPVTVQAAADKVSAVAAKMTGTSSIKLRLTTYYPLEAKTAAQKKMEGAPVDRKGAPLHYLEDVIAGKDEWVSCAGDSAAWPYGQLIFIDAYPGIKFRVVDTGGNFLGSDKVYRASGREPIDVAVRSSSTKVPTDATAQIVRGDHLDKTDRKVAVAKFKGQKVVVGGLFMLGAA